MRTNLDLTSQILEYLLKGIKSCAECKSLNPLERAIQVCSQLTRSNVSASKDTASIISCDSFCAPHHISQHHFYLALSEIYEGRTSFTNIPIGHYLSSQPDLRLLEYANKPTDLLRLNHQIVSGQESNISQLATLTKYYSFLSPMSTALENLHKVIPAQSYLDFHLYGRNITAIAFRDFSLTFKVTFEQATDPTKSNKASLALTNKLFIWYLLVLIITQAGSTHIFCMSNYSASRIANLFARSSGIVYRQFSPVDDTFIVSQQNSPTYFRLYENITSPTQMLLESNIARLARSSPTQTGISMVSTYIENRFGSKRRLAYSLGETIITDERERLDRSIKDSKAKNKVVSIFTSSPDENDGMQIAYEFLEEDLSHLSPSVFSSHDDWVLSTLEFFAGQRTSVTVVVRFHPRLAADHRGLPESTEFHRLWGKCLDITAESSCEILLVHPSSPISSYWLGMQSDVVLNGWSTIGIELALRKKIVTNAFYKTRFGGSSYYPVHLNTPPLKSKQEYFERIYRLLGGTFLESDTITYNQAAVALLANKFSACIDVSDVNCLRNQISEPKMLTSTISNYLTV